MRGVSEPTIVDEEYGNRTRNSLFDDNLQHSRTEGRASGLKKQDQKFFNSFFQKRARSTEKSACLFENKTFLWLYVHMLSQYADVFK